MNATIEKFVVDYTIKPYGLMQPTRDRTKMNSREKQKHWISKIYVYMYKCIGKDDEEMDFLIFAKHDVFAFSLSLPFSCSFLPPQFQQMRHIIRIDIEVANEWAIHQLREYNAPRALTTARVLSRNAKWNA